MKKRNYLKNVRSDVELRKEIFPPRHILGKVDNSDNKQGSEGIIQGIKRVNSRKNSLKVAIEKKRIATRTIGYVKIPFSDVKAIAGTISGEKTLELRFRMTNKKGLNIYSKRENIDVDRVVFEHELDYLKPVTAGAFKKKNKKRNITKNANNVMQLSLNNDNSFPVITNIYSKIPNPNIPVKDSKFI